MASWFQRNAKQGTSSDKRHLITDDQARLFTSIISHGVRLSEKMAHAMAAQRQRATRLRQHKFSQVTFAFVLLGLGASGGFVGARLLVKNSPAPSEQILLSRYPVVPVANPIVDQVPRHSNSNRQHKAAAVAVVPAPAKPETAAALTKASPAAGPNSEEPPLPQGKYYEARPDTSISTILPLTGLKVINVPVDGVLNLDVDGAVRAFKVGDVLPDGSRLKQANAHSGSFETNARRN